ncbi:hypothetical protein ACKFKF_33810 [Phormidesmis sp. 146-12]
MIILISALLFWSAIAVTQAWLVYHRCDHTSYLWVGLSIVGLFVATTGSIIIGILAIFVFRLDILQNNQQAAIALLFVVAAFGLIMILSQWRILKGRVNSAIFQAGFNVVFGTSIWLFLVSKIEVQQEITLEMLSFILLSVFLGIGIGGVIHKILNW